MLTFGGAYFWNFMVSALDLIMWRWEIMCTSEQFTEFLYLLPLPGESVFARCLSSLQSERVSASKELKGPSKTKYSGDKKEFIEHIRQVRQ